MPPSASPTADTPGTPDPTAAPGTPGTPGGGTAPGALTGREPRVPAQRLVADLVPPPRFDAVRFSTYVPDPARPGQAEAVRTLAAFAAGLSGGATARSGGTPASKGVAGGGGGAPASEGVAGGGSRRPWWRRAPKEPAGPRGVYLDGGFGVGKTHLLASLWHATEAPAERKGFCTFVELTHLVGALGFQQTIRTLGGHRLLCIDEFELDDPGDTVLVSSLLGRLVDSGVALAATSNTLPGKLGEGRFAAADFLREIQGLAARFRPLRIDGDDYRHRGLPPAPAPLADEAVARAARTVPGATLDAFPDLLGHLARVHPSRYGALTDGVRTVCLTGVRPVADEATALRLVVLADRLYDREIPVLASGVPFDRLFGAEMLAGGYRKKYFRAISRLTALARDAHAATGDVPTPED